MLQLSQTQLNLLETCPRKFQHTYLEQLGALATPEQQERLTLGSQFHLLMQQHELGLPIEPLVQEDTQLKGWYEAFVQAAPQILALSSQGEAIFRQSEHQRYLEFNDDRSSYLLTVIYDLLVCDEQQARILDWKTYPRPQNARWLQQNWQTQLYPFVLAETSPYLPEQISMTYWFFQGSDRAAEPQSLNFPYNNTLHEQTRQDLERILSRLTQWLQQYETQGEPFPQLPEFSPDCQSCTFALRCQRSQPNNSEGNDRAFLLNLADIQEVPI